MFDAYNICYTALKKLSFADFTAVLCVLLERRCKDEKMNVKETAGELYRTIVDVNNKLGEL